MFDLFDVVAVIGVSFSLLGMGFAIGLWHGYKVGYHEAAHKHRDRGDS
jgi:hypothetical protein